MNLNYPPPPPPAAAVGKWGGSIVETLKDGGERAKK